MENQRQWNLVGCSIQSYNSYRDRMSFQIQHYVGFCVIPYFNHILTMLVFLGTLWLTKKWERKIQVVWNKVSAF